MNSVKKISIIKTVIIIVCSTIVGIFIWYVLIWFFIIAALAQYTHHERRKPREDSDYISRLGFYARDSLPSAKVIQKDYLEGEYTSAVYRVDSIDFAKVLNGIHQERRFFEGTPWDTMKTLISQDTIIEFNNSAIELLWKENLEVEDLDFRYNINGPNRIGFKYPDLIVYDKTLYD